MNTTATPILSKLVAYKHLRRTYLAAGGAMSGRVYIYELVAGQLIERYIRKTPNLPKPVFSWHAHQGRLYLAIGSQNKNLYLFEYNTEANRLEKLAVYKTQDWDSVPARWYSRGDELHLAVPFGEGVLHHFNVRGEIKGRRR